MIAPAAGGCQRLLSGRCVSMKASSSCRGWRSAPAISKPRARQRRALASDDVLDDLKGGLPSEAHA